MFDPNLLAVERYIQEPVEALLWEPNKGAYPKQQVPCMRIRLQSQLKCLVTDAFRFANKDKGHSTAKEIRQPMIVYGVRFVNRRVWVGGVEGEGVQREQTSRFSWPRLWQSLPCSCA